MSKNSVNKLESTCFVLIALLLLNVIIYSPSINGYFLADDFIHISYLSEVIHKHPLAIFANFYTNWLQSAGTQFYRPLITLSLACDYLVWGSNAIGFHLSNLAFQIISTILLYFVAHKIAMVLGNSWAKRLAAITAALFAVYPLHPEVVSWIIGRVDSIATMFYLAAFFLFIEYQKSLRNQQSLKLPASYMLGSSLFFYFCSVLSKEIAVTLPIILWLWLFLFTDSEKKSWTKIGWALKRTMPYWSLLVLYLGIRTFSLGTIYGGYGGSLSIDITQVMQRFSAIKLIFPFNDSLLSPRNFLRYVLCALYGLGAIVLLIRFLRKQVSHNVRKLLLFAIVWSVTSLLPALPVLELGEDLAGSRLIYLASAAICFLLSLVVVPVSDMNPQGNSEHGQFIDRVLVSLGWCICGALITTFGVIAYANNVPWRNASDEARALQKDLIGQQEKIGSGQKLVLLNIPNSYKGAHILYNGTTLELLCSPALTGRNTSPRIVTFEAPLFGDPDLLNCSRLQRFFKEKGKYVFLAWAAIPNKEATYNKKLCNSNHGGSLKEVDLQDKSSIELDLTNRLVKIDSKSEMPSQKSSATNKIVLSPDKFESATIEGLNLDTSRAAFLEITIETKQTNEFNRGKRGWLQLQWSSGDKDAPVQRGCLTQPLILEESRQSYLFNLAEHKSWLLCRNIRTLTIMAGSGNYKLEIQNVRFRNPLSLVPQFDLDPKLVPHEDNVGLYHLNHDQIFYCIYDASKITGAVAVVYEISNPNIWFEHENQTFNANHLSEHTIVRKQLQHLQGEFMISGNQIGTGYFEVHLAALDKNGKVLGLTSYPICGQVAAP